jgi:tRNA (guanine-N7-)-methyltransferase
VPYSDSAVNLDAVFGRAAPKILEIGFGMGETTLAIAIANPQRDYLGIEVHAPGVGALLRAVDSGGLGNVRINQHDAVEVLQHMIVPDCLTGVHIFFPDPWPKKRHHKRRLIQADFVHLVATRLLPDGYVHCATDWQEYAEVMLRVLLAEPLLRNSSNRFAPRPSYRPQTKFEARGLGLGHGVWDLVFRRV